MVVSTATAQQPHSCCTSATQLLHSCCTAAAQLLLSNSTATAQTNQQRSIRGSIVIGSHGTISTGCSTDTSNVVQPQVCATVLVEDLYRTGMCRSTCWRGLLCPFQPLADNVLFGAMMHLPCALCHQPIVSLLIKVVLIVCNLAISFI